MTSVLVVSGLAITQQTQAATTSTGKFTINNKRYNAASDHSGSGWRWDTETATLTLNGFSSDYGLVFDNLSKSVTIKVRGTNTISTTSNVALDFSETSQNISFVGKKNGTLTVTDTDCEVLMLVKNNLSISDMKMNLSCSGSDNYSGLLVGGTVTLDNIAGSWSFADADVGVASFGKITKTNSSSSAKICTYQTDETVIYSFTTGTTKQYTDSDDFIEEVAKEITFKQKTPVTGATYTVSGVKYLVTDSSSVTVTGCKSSVKKLVIPATVKIYSKTMKVTQVEEEAFASDTTLKSVVIKGQNLTKIGKKAFYKCSNIKMVKFSKKTSTKIGKKAFKGISTSAKIKIVKKSYKAIKKKIKSSGISSKVKFVKI